MKKDIKKNTTKKTPINKKKKDNRFVIVREDMMDDYNLDYLDAILITKIFLLWRNGKKDFSGYHPIAVSALEKVTKNLTQRMIRYSLEKIEKTNIFSVKKINGKPTEYYPNLSILEKYYNINTKEIVKELDNNFWNS